MASSSTSARAERLRQVREDTRQTQLQFLQYLNAAARDVLGRGVREYSQSTLSKLETGAQEATFEDIAVYALADFRRRGKLWLAWGEEVDTTLILEERAGPSIIKSPMKSHTSSPAPGKHSVPKKRQA